MSLYVVDRILDKRIIKGKIEYKVKWEGYSQKQCTWQPPQNLTTIKPMIEEFNQKHYKDKGAPITKGSKPYTPPQRIEPEPQQDDAYDAYEDEELEQVEDKPQRSDAKMMYEEVLSDVEEAPQVEEGEREENQMEVEQYVEEQPEQDQQEQQQMIEQNQEEQQEAEVEPPPRKQVKKQSKMPQKSSEATELNNKGIFENGFDLDAFNQTEQSPSFPKNTSFNNKQSSIPLQQSRKQPIQQSKTPVQQLSSITNNMRFVGRNPPQVSTSKHHSYGPGQPPLEVKIRALSHDCEGKKVFIVEDGALTYVLSHQQVMNTYIDALIRFYQSKIQFVKIPRLPK